MCCVHRLPSCSGRHCVILSKWKCVINIRRSTSFCSFICLSPLARRYVSLLPSCVELIGNYRWGPWFSDVRKLSGTLETYEHLKKMLIFEKSGKMYDIAQTWWQLCNGQMLVSLLDNETMQFSCWKIIGTAWKKRYEKLKKNLRTCKGWSYASCDWMSIACFEITYAFRS